MNRQARAGCLSGPAGLGRKMLKYLYLWNVKHFKHEASMQSHLWHHAHNLFNPVSRSIQAIYYSEMSSELAASIEPTRKVQDYK